MTARLFFAAVAALMLGHAAHAEDFPARPIRILVGYAPGGTADCGGILQHTGMLEDESRRGEFRRKLCRVSHLAGKDLQIEAQAIIGEVRDIAPELRLTHQIGPSRGEAQGTNPLPAQPCPGQLVDPGHQRSTGEAPVGRGIPPGADPLAD